MGESETALAWNPARIDALLTLRCGEATARDWLAELTPERMTESLFRDFVTAMRRGAVAVPALPSGLRLDCCGTGGSGQPHFNTSTTVAFVLAAGGVPVVKFGNRAMTSASGSFDFLEALGIPAHLPLAATPEILASGGLVFAFAPQYYPQLAAFTALRRSLKLRTIFNFLGPLLNPFRPTHRVLGVSHRGMQDVMAAYLAQEGDNQAAVVIHGQPAGGGVLDEIPHAGAARLVSVRGGVGVASVFQPTLPEAVASGFATDFTPAENARLFHALLAGELPVAHPVYQMVCLNAGAGFWVAGMSESVEAGATLAQELLASGEVQACYERCRRIYVRYSG